MTVQFIQPEASALSNLAKHLREGMPIAVPTETVYGLAANAYDAKAVAQIFSIKDRPDFDPLIVHIPRSWSTLGSLDGHGLVDSQAMTAAAKATFGFLQTTFWPGPLTIVVPRGPRVPLLVTSGLDAVAIRCSSHPIFQDLLERCQLPLAAPSANRFGRISPTTAPAVAQELAERLTFILDGGPCTFGVESTVIAVNDDGSISLLRPGGLALERLEATGLTVHKAGSASQSKQSPGHLAQHYAPRKPFLRWDQRPKTLADKHFANYWSEAGYKRIAGIHWGSILPTWVETFPAPYSAFFPCGDSAPDGLAAAQHLFALMRQLDAEAFDALVVAPLPHRSGLWLAIDDRLRRASRPWFIAP